MRSIKIGKTSFNFNEIFEEEKKYILRRRQRLEVNDVETKNNDNAQLKDLFGIALSGGGIRSATLNMGVLNYLNDINILKLADYISSVSGGGFIHSYIQTRLRGEKNFDELFQGVQKNEKTNHITKDNSELRERCDYLIPDRSFLTKITSYIRAYGAIISSFLMNLFWLVSFIIMLFSITHIIISLSFLVFPELKATYLFYTLNFLAVIIIYHFFFFVLRHYGVWSSNVLNYIEGFTFSIFIITFALSIIFKIDVFPWVGYAINLRFIFPESNLFNNLSPATCLILSILLFLLFGFFSNPNILSLHRYYRDRIAHSFIYPFFKKKGINHFKLTELINDEESINPYPLLNTCLNITERKRKNVNKTIEGSKNTKNIYGIESSDYFLLSPKFCGSSLTNYQQTETDYRKLTLPTAVAVSGSAINTLMGNKTNRFISIFIYLFNAVLGYWIKNPNWRKIKPFKHIQNDFLITYLTFWPYYLGRSMFGKADHSRGRVNISDGGHIENLAVFELLRRRCKLIIAIDASCDPNYNFSDLSNLVVRAREKLGLKIEFVDKPEEVIKPSPSSGFSIEHYATACISPLKRKESKTQHEESSDYRGILIYIKSSLKAPQQWENEGGAKNQDEANAFNYKINHPLFPHESTIDQFFDPDQWNAYYYLGRFIAQDIFSIIENYKFENLKDLITYCEKNLKAERCKND